MKDNPVKCAHPPCLCVVTESKEFCSEYCSAAGKDEVEISCDCGHPGCGLLQSPIADKSPSTTAA